MIDFELGQEYTRKDIAEMLSRPNIANTREGLVYLPGKVLLFVTLEKDEQKNAKLRYNDFFENEIFHWDSQVSQHYNTAKIQEIVKGQLDVFLFARIYSKTKSRTNPFVYCGAMEYVGFQQGTANPVHFYFASQDYGREKSDALQRIYSWKPNSDLVTVNPVAPPSVKVKAVGVRTRKSQAYAEDQELKSAIELHAMKRIQELYEQQGYLVTDVSKSESVDFKCSKGAETRWLEVKGTTSTGEEILLTANEVRRAQSGDYITDLCIVHSIKINTEDAVKGVSEGVIRVEKDWNPAAKDLVPTQYRYKLGDIRR